MWLRQLLLKMEAYAHAWWLSTQGPGDEGPDDYSLHKYTFSSPESPSGKCMSEYATLKQRSWLSICHTDTLHIHMTKTPEAPESNLFICSECGKDGEVRWSDATALGPRVMKLPVR